MSWNLRKKKLGIFVPFILSQHNFFKICALSQCIAYWIHFPYIHTFTYQNSLLHTLLLLVSKIVKSLHCIFKKNIIYFSAQKFQFGVYFSHYLCGHYFLRNKDTILKFSRYLSFSIWVFFQEQSQFKGQQVYLLNSSLPPPLVSQTLRD